LKPTFRAADSIEAGAAAEVAKWRDEVDDGGSCIDARVRDGGGSGAGEAVGGMEGLLGAL
jgi:hypothetical protein